MQQWLTGTVFYGSFRHHRDMKAKTISVDDCDYEGDGDDI